MSLENSAIKLLQITDTHCYANDKTRLEWSSVDVYPNQNLQAVLKALAQQYPNYQGLMITGDLAQEETAATYQRLDNFLQDFPLPIYALPGNHDIPALMRKHLSHVAMPEHIHWGKWHGLLLDTSEPQRPDGHLSEANYLALQTQLEAIPNEDYVAIFMHHHPLEIGSAWMDIIGLQYPFMFWHLLKAYPQVKVIFTGHIHQAFSGEYVYADKREIKVFGTPATSVQMKALNPTMIYDHCAPAWREIHLLENGEVETQVHYLA